MEIKTAILKFPIGKNSAITKQRYVHRQLCILI